MKVPSVGLVLASLTSSLVPSCYGAIFKNFTELQSPDSYDFIVVGAGPGGSTVANRLTEDPGARVLLLEAGGPNEDDITVDIPLLCTRLTPHTRYDWNYSTIAQAGLNNRSVPFPTGFGIGGSTSVNCLVYTRGSRDDINKWAELSGDEGWGWEAMQQYYKKTEFFNPPRDGHNTTGQFDPAVHGFEGHIGVSLPGAARFIDGPILNTTQELAEFPYREDVNSGEQTGISWVQALVKNGSRSSAREYLVDAQTRDNFDVLLFSKVARVLQTGDNSTFRSVEFMNDESFRNLNARKELILSAGAVNTPNILMHSGIGEAALLNSVGISVLHDLPSVGKNLTDHVGVSTTFILNTTKTWDTINRNETAVNELIARWNESKTGFLVDTSENHHAWLRLPDNSSVFDQFPDPSSGNLTAHYEFLFQDGLAAVTPEGNYMNMPTACVSPASRGSVSINSSDPFAVPLVDPALLSAPVDILIVRESIKSARRFVQAPAWNGLVLGSLNNNATTDEEIDEFIRNNAVSFFHPVSTSSMSPKDATHGVVDPDLMVKGLKGLRIVDAGVAPHLPAAHTSATVYAIAERAADIIKAANNMTTTQ